DYDNMPIELQGTEALGQGFDLASDFRLQFVKRCPSGARLVVLDESNKRDVKIPGGGTIANVPECIRIGKGDHTRFKSDVLQFNQMSELLNQKSSVQGKIPSGYLNNMFHLSGAWLNDAAEARHLAFDGYFISLYDLHLIASPLILNDHVKKSVPRLWDPASLSRFIKTYGTHVVVGMAIGGQDLICVKQTSSSPIPPAELKGYLEELGDCLFSDATSPILDRTSNDNSNKLPEVFKRMLLVRTLQFASIVESSSKDGLTLIWSKRGGNVFAQRHSSWLQTVAAKPEAILFKFVPITSLLNGIPGSGYLSHAINLYLRYKPPLEDLPYFLEFQVPRQWAPSFSDLPLRHRRRRASVPSLQFSFMGPKISVNLSQVTSNHRPVVGLRLYLEGTKSNELAVHVQHLSSLPNFMTRRSSSPFESRWRGSDDYDSGDQFLEAVRWKGFSNVCSAAVKYDPTWARGSSGAFVVTGAQLTTKGKWPSKVLHLRLLYTHIPSCSIRKSEWGSAPEGSGKTSFFSNLSTTFAFTQRGNKKQQQPQRQLPAALNSGVYPDGPPVPIGSTKLVKYVDSAEISRGPYDVPGHWLVIGGRLVVGDGGKIGLQVKFGLLDYHS
ncbi:hypothetical protein M569_12969, partial [Genlisea aurea]